MSVDGEIVSEDGQQISAAEQPKETSPFLISQVSHYNMLFEYSKGTGKGYRLQFARNSHYANNRAVIFKITRCLICDIK